MRKTFCFGESTGRIRNYCMSSHQGLFNTWCSLSYNSMMLRITLSLHVWILIKQHLYIVSDDKSVSENESVHKLIKSIEHNELESIKYVLFFDKLITIIKVFVLPTHFDVIVTPAYSLQTLLIVLALSTQLICAFICER